MRRSKDEVRERDADLEIKHTEEQRSGYGGEKGKESLEGGRRKRQPPIGRSDDGHRRTPEQERSSKVD